MRLAGLALVLLAVAVTAGCGAKKSSAPQVFRPFAPASVEAAALKSGTCLAARTDDHARPHGRRWARTRCARHMPFLNEVMVDFDRCPVQYVARGAAFGVVVCKNEAAATTEWRVTNAAIDDQFGVPRSVRNVMRIGNVLVYGYGGREARVRALARALRA